MFPKISRQQFSDSVLKSPNITIVSFSYEWSGSAYINESKINNFVLSQIDEINVYSIDVEKESDLALEYNALLVTCIVIFKNGKRIAKLSGLVSESELKETIEPHLT